MNLFAAELSRRLRRALLPASTVNAIMAETEAHLRDRVEELTEQGMDPIIASEVAVAGFGAPKSYARAIAGHAFGDRNSVQARCAAAGLGAFLLVFILCLLQNWIRTPTALQLSVIPGGIVSRGFLLYLLLVAAFCSFSFLGKRPQFSLWGKVGAAGLIIAFLYGGFHFVSTPGFTDIERTEIAEHRADAAYEADIANDVRLLRIGCQTFENGGSIPAALLQDGKIIIPAVNIMAARGAMTDDALRTPPDFSHYRYTGNMSYFHAFYRAAPYRVAENRDEARKAWRKAGPRWLEARQYTLDNDKAIEARWARLQAQTPTGFCFLTAVDHATLFGVGCVYILLLDITASFFGRHAFRLMRNRPSGLAA